MSVSVLGAVNQTRPANFAWIAMQISQKYSVILTFHKYRRNIVIYHVFTLIIRLKYEENVWLISNIYGFQNDHGTRFGET